MKLLILYSAIKPDFLLQESAAKDYLQVLIKDSFPFPSSIQLKDYEMIYDLTYSATISYQLQDLSKNLNLNYLKGYSSNVSEDNLSVDPTDSSNILLNLLEKLSIKKWAVVYSLAYSANYQSLLDQAAVRVIFPAEGSLHNIVSTLSQLKYTEVNTICLLIPGKSASTVLSSLSSETFTGYAWILPEFSDYLSFSTYSSLEQQGVIRISRSDSTSFVSELVEHFVLCPFELFHVCLKEFKAKTWHILNVVDSNYATVGQCDPYCSINKEIVWPIGVTNIEDSRKSLKVSYEASILDPQGNSLDFLVPAYRGVELGLAFINNLTIPFILEATKLKLGGTYYNETYVKSALSSSKDNLGYALISPAMSDLTVNLYNELQNNSISIPMIAYSTTVSLLSSTSTFPLFARVCMPDTYVTVIISLMIKYFGWQKIGVIYIDNLFSRTLYNEFEDLVLDYGIQILNQPNNKLSENYNMWDNKENESVFKDLGESEARIIVVFCYTNEIDKIIIKMQELGYSGSEYEYIAVGWLVDELVNPKVNYNETRLNIIRNSLKGSLMFFPVSFIDDFGSQVKELYIETYKEDPVGYTAFAFDAALAIYNTFDQLIINKKDYSNPAVFIKGLREIKYKGATGTVTFQSSKNDRSPMDHYILNTRKVNESKWEIKIIGVFSPTSLNVFTFYDNITWPEDKIPSDSPKKYSCPFAPEEVKIDKIGVIAMFLVISFSNFFILCIAIRGWNKWPPTVQILTVDKKIEMTFMDMMNICKIVVELFQYIGLIPSLPLILAIFKTIGNVITLDLEKMYKLEPNVFWTVYQFVLGFTGLTILCRILQKYRLNVPYTVVFCSLSSDIFFVSTFSSLLNIYSCYETASGPFLHYDCHTRCWQGKHLIYVVSNSIVLIMYCLLMVYEKPKWSSGLINDQHVSVSAKHTYAKTLIQALLVSLKKIIWLVGSQIYTLIIFLFIAIYSVYCIMRSSYNIQILRLWHVLANIAVALVCLFSFFCELSNSKNSPIWLIVTLVCWGVLLIIGLFYQKLRKMNWPFVTGAVNVVMLKFAFQNKGVDWVKRNSKTHSELNIPEANNELTLRPHFNVPDNSINI